jgi:uncharacterized protein involved in exopolysaccharide biosynthesis
MKLRPARLLGIFLILLGVACLGRSAFVFLAPPEYLATTRIKILHNELSGGTEPSNSSALNANETDVEMLQSELVLGPVAETLDLTNKWQTDQASAGKNAIQLLKQRLKVQSSPGTAFVNISVRDRDPAESAQIANIIADAYIKHRREAALELAQSSVRSFAELRAEVLEKIEAAELEANTMKTNLHIAILPPEDQMRFPLYRTMREEMAELTNSLKTVEKKMEIASRFQEHPPVGAEIVDRADIPRRPIEKNLALPGGIAGGGLALIVAGFLLGKRRSTAQRPTKPSFLLL